MLPQVTLAAWRHRPPDVSAPRPDQGARNASDAPVCVALVPDTAPVVAAAWGVPKCPGTPGALATGVLWTRLPGQRLGRGSARDASTPDSRTTDAPAPGSCRQESGLR